MPAEAYKLDVPIPVAVVRDRNAWKWQAGTRKGRRPSLTAAREAAEDAYVATTGEAPGPLVRWHACPAADVETPEAPARPVAPVSRPVDRGPVERPALGLAEVLRLRYGRVEEDDERYLSWLHTLPSVLPGEGRIVAHHEPPRSHVGTDYDAVPLAECLHEIRHGHATPGPGEPTAEEIERACLAARLPLVLAWWASEDAPGRAVRRRTVAGVEMAEDGSGWRSTRPVTEDEAAAVREEAGLGQFDD